MPQEWPKRNNVGTLVCRKGSEQCACLIQINLDRERSIHECGFTGERLIKWWGEDIRATEECVRRMNVLHELETKAAAAPKKKRRRKKVKR